MLIGLVIQFLVNFVNIDKSRFMGSLRKFLFSFFGKHTSYSLVGSVYKKKIFLLLIIQN